MRSLASRRLSAGEAWAPQRLAWVQAWRSSASSAMAWLRTFATTATRDVTFSVMALENSPTLTIRKRVTSAHLQTCRACAHEFRVPASLVGKRVACPHCRRPIEIRAETGSDDKLVGKELGGCRLVRRLGAGAIGVVYQAEQ